MRGAKLRHLFVAFVVTGHLSWSSAVEPPAGEVMAAETAHVDAADAAGLDLANLRDPFRRPIVAGSNFKPLSELEYYPVEQFRMVGVITGPEQKKAMIVGPDGKTHFVAEKSKIGIRKGVVTRILPNMLTVRERVLNSLGKEEVVNTEIRLVEKGNVAPEATGGNP